MESIQRCFKQISKVREVTENLEVAYVARSRINRLILTLVEILANETGFRYSNRPGLINLPMKTPDQLKKIANICNRILSSTATLCQPSEPLDERWKSGWSTLLFELDELEKGLHKLSINS